MIVESPIIMEVRLLLLLSLLEDIIENLMLSGNRYPRLSRDNSSGRTANPRQAVQSVRSTWW